MFYDTLENFIRLRYQLLPYIYSVAARVTLDDLSMYRPLVFDYPQDSQVLDDRGSYLFGPSFLVHPITHPMYFGEDGQAMDVGSYQEPVYLPAGTVWYDFWTGDC